MANRYKYYVLKWDGTIKGPMSLKSATEEWKRSAEPAEILMTIINCDGKEVK